MKYNFIKKGVSFILRHRLPARVGSLALAGMLAVGVSIVAAGLTLGFKVNYAGAFIATVKNEAVFEDAREIAVGRVESRSAAKAIEKPELSLTLTVSDRLDTAPAVAKAIIENTEEIVSASALVVNGERVATVESGEITAYLETSRQRFNIEGAENTSEFADEVEVEEGYYLKSETDSLETVKAVIDALPVKTVAVVTTDIQVPFGKKTVKSAEKEKGYSAVTTAGQNGINRKTESVELVNGKEVSRSELSLETVKAPVEEITTVGTAIPVVTQTQRAAAQSAGFILPLNRGSFTITSYWGDGRGHKGMDLAANKGTPIFAAAAGKVVSAGWDGDYGYSVVVDHGNGIKTRYAHQSALSVKAGQTVAQGDQLGLVGSTGNSSGNHLHFEVIVNGVRKNPAPYIGL